MAAIVHSVFVLAAVLALAPVLGYLPMASLAALLLIVAWNMSEVKHFAHALRVAPKSDVLVLLTCFLLTVIFDMVVSVTAGVLLAALLFMRRMAEVSGVRLIDQHPIASAGLPKDCRDRRAALPHEWKPSPGLAAVSLRSLPVSKPVG